MTYPSSTDYVSAVQDPRTLLDGDLRRAAFAVDPLLQIPIPASGNSAVVFKAAIDGRSHALRFFIREDASSPERYRSLHAYLMQHRLTDCTAAAEWVDDAILVNQRRWQMVKMQWIEGRSLDAYVDHLVQCGDTEALETLAQAWRQLVRRMQEKGFAHGDLQHGNVLVDTGSHLRLVDFDGSWIEGATGPTPTETGHPNYQLRGRPWGQYMDTFPGLLVYTALRSLALRPGLWEEFSVGENILFIKDDFVRPFDTPIWSALLALGDAEVTHCVSQLRAACAAPGNLTISLESVIGEVPHPVSEPVTEPVRVLSPLQPGSPWWAQTGGGAAGGSTAAPAAAAATSTLPPPPPKTPYGKPESDGFSAEGAGRVWFEPPSSHVAAPPERPPATSGPGRPPRRRRPAAWVLILLLMLTLLVVTIVLLDGSSTGSGPYSSDPTYSPTREDTETATDTTLLLDHIPSAIAASCTPVDPPPGALVAVECSDPYEPITVLYIQFFSKSDMDDAFASDYSSSESGSCSNGEAGTQPYVQGGDPAGQYSCYDSEYGNHVSWTHEPTDIMAVSYSPALTYGELELWWREAGPL